MKKYCRTGILFLLAAALLLAPAFACAVYEQYLLTAGDASSAAAWGIFPVDAHNAVVVARSFYKPWHVTWYRDGALYRDLTGSSGSFLEIPQPVIGKDGSVRILRRVWEGVPGQDGEETEVRPEDYKAYLAEWTENGLEGDTAAPDLHPGGRAFRILDDGGSLMLQDLEAETSLPGDLTDSRYTILDSVRLGDDVYLLEVSDSAEQERFLVCMDRGREKYRIEGPDSYYEILPDGRGGFFRTDGGPTGDYTPVCLVHYDAGGRADRTLQLGGDRVVVWVSESLADKESGLCTLYGTAVANSRKIYTAFTMTVDADLNVCGLDVRAIDPAYRDYSPSVYLAPDGTAYVFIREPEIRKGLRPALVPFSVLEPYGENLGLALR